MIGRDETKETLTEFASTIIISACQRRRRVLSLFCMTRNCDLLAQWNGFCKVLQRFMNSLALVVQQSPTSWQPPTKQHVSIGATHTCLIQSECVSTNQLRHLNNIGMQEEVKVLLSMLGGALMEIQAESRMTLTDVEVIAPLQRSSSCNPLSNHFCPTNATQRQLYPQLTTNELILQGLDLNGFLETRQEKLWHGLKGELTINRLC